VHYLLKEIARTSRRNNTVMKAEGKIGMTQKKEMHGIAVFTFG